MENSIEMERKPLNSNSRLASDIRNYRIFTILYFIQGIPIGLFLQAIPLFLTEKGASFTDLARYSLVVYPFSFKLLIAPFADVYYIKSLGKRKCYVLTTQIFISVFLFYITWNWDYLMHHENISQLIFFCFSCFFFTALQDIAVDGWVICAISNDHSHWGSVAQSLGQMIGSVLTGICFIQVARFFHPFYFFFPLIIMILGFTFYIWKFVPENSSADHFEESLSAVFKSIKRFYTNKYLRNFLILELFFDLPFCAIEQGVPVKLMAQGVTKESLAFIGLLMIPVSIIANLVFGSIIKKNKEFSLYLKLVLFRLVMAFCLIYFFYNYEHWKEYIFYILCIINSLQTFFKDGIYVIRGAFRNRVADEKSGGTFLTVMNSFGNLGPLFVKTTIFTLIDYTNYDSIVFFGLVVGVMCFGVHFKNILDLQKVSDEKLKEHSEKNN